MGCEESANGIGQRCSGDGDFWGSPIPIPKSRGWGLGMSHFRKKSPGMGIFGDGDGFSWDGMGIPENPQKRFVSGKRAKIPKNELSRIVKMYEIEGFSYLFYFQTSEITEKIKVLKIS